MHARNHIRRSTCLRVVHCDAMGCCFFPTLWIGGMIICMMQLLAVQGDHPISCGSDEPQPLETLVL